MHIQGRIQDFHLEGGGGAKDYVRACMQDREARSPLMRGVFDALSCYRSLIFQHSDTKWDLKKKKEKEGGKKYIYQILGGAVTPPLLKSATVIKHDAITC